MNARWSCATHKEPPHLGFQASVWTRGTCSTWGLLALPAPSGVQGGQKGPRGRVQCGSSPCTPRPGQQHPRHSSREGQAGRVPPPAPGLAAPQPLPAPASLCLCWKDTRGASSCPLISLPGCPHGVAVQVTNTTASCKGEQRQCCRSQRRRGEVRGDAEAPKPSKPPLWFYSQQHRGAVSILWAPASRIWPQTCL